MREYKPQNQFREALIEYLKVKHKQIISEITRIHSLIVKEEMEKTEEVDQWLDTFEKLSNDIEVHINFLS